MNDITLDYPDWYIVDSENTRPEWDYKPCNRSYAHNWVDDHPYPDCIAKITKNIFLAAGLDILKPKNFLYFDSWFKNNNIQLIISATNLVGVSEHLRDLDVEFYELELEKIRPGKYSTDINDYISIFNVFDDVYELYKKFVEDGNILIYCKAGQDRSVLILLSILLNIQLENMEYPDVEGNLTYIKKFKQDAGTTETKRLINTLNKYVDYKIQGIYGFG